MELIKTPSFSAMDKLAETLAEKNKQFTYDQIHQMLGHFLLDYGSKKFVELYNDVAKNKDFTKAFTTLNL